MYCKTCNKEILTTDTSKYPKEFCSYSCYEKWNRCNKTPNCSCVVCGKPMYIKPYRLNRLVHGITCSKECANKNKSVYSSGPGNHQFGLKGDKNSSYKGKEITRINNKLTDVMVYDPTHPYCTENLRVKKHRLIVEENYKLFSNTYFEEINGRVVLKPEIIVHHLDGDHDNNDISNLVPLTKSEHSKLHISQNEIIRDTTTGKIIGVKKPNSVGGNP